MRRSRITTLTAFLTVLALSGWATALATSALKAEPTATAVVNVQHAFESLDEKTQVEADLKTRQEQVLQERQEKQESLKQLQQDLEILAPGTPAFQQKQEQLQKKALELKVWIEYQGQRLERERIIRLEALYRKLLESIGRVAKDNGYHVVLFQEDEVNFRNASANQISAAVQMRKVLWADEKLDLTDEVIQRMNNEWQNMSR
ncbi:MAG: OmpH family outer membrane protein [Phycisphaeraceae bacterium]|nr:OmpH family outer membrane protein [Phycisphaeraceae bacterium]